ncbi:MAG: phospholipid-binding protein MlaC [Succinivibrionaceae bacterium]
MNIFFKISLAILIIVVCNNPIYANANENNSNTTSVVSMADPYSLIQTLANNTFSKIRAHKADINDPKVARKIIEEELLPYIDNKYSSYLVIGSNLKNTTEEQRAKFVDAFTKYIVATYADALRKYTDQIIEVEESKPITEKIVSVKVTIKQDEKMSYEVLFKMRKNSKTGEWKAFDMVAEGISLLSAKQSEMSGMIREKGIVYVTNMLLEHVEKTLVQN